MVARRLTDGVVLLREWADDDAPWYVESIRDAEIQRYTAEPETLTVEQLLQATAVLRTRSDAVGFIICDAVTGERLGNVGITREGTEGNVSYWLARSARGRGAATRAVRLVSEWALRSFFVDSLWLWTRADNTASGRVAERAGYRRSVDRDADRRIRGEVWPTTAYTFNRVTGT